MRRGWVWGAYALSLAWVGVVFVYVDRHFDAARKEAFRQEGLRLMVEWADRLAEAVEAPDQDRLLRRFSGEMESRSVALFNDEGRLLQSAGEISPTPPRLPFSDPVAQSLNDETWAYLSPLWVAGRRAGYLAWVRDASRLKIERAHAQRGLLAAWAWWAAAGAIASAYAARSSPNLKIPVG